MVTEVVAETFQLLESPKDRESGYQQKVDNRPDFSRNNNLSGNLWTSQMMTCRSDDMDWIDWALLEPKTKRI